MYTEEKIKEKLRKSFEAYFKEGKGNIEEYFKRRYEIETRPPYLTKDLDLKRLELEFKIIDLKTYNRYSREFAGAQEWG